jgi:hypothetical protein
MMRPDAKVEKVYLYPKPVDFRKSIDGLAALVEGQEPYAWLRHALERLPQALIVEDFDALLPWNCMPQIPR